MALRSPGGVPGRPRPRPRLRHEDHHVQRLPKARRKELQIEHAPHKSPQAALLKICDKLSNIRAVAETPPSDWPQARRAAYLDWAEAVVAGLPAGADPARPAFAAQLAASRAAVAARP